jgi:hypothetical protein
LVSQYELINILLFPEKEAKSVVLLRRKLWATHNYPAEKDPIARACDFPQNEVN